MVQIFSLQSKYYFYSLNDSLLSQYCLYYSMCTRSLITLSSPLVYTFSLRQLRVLEHTFLRDLTLCLWKILESRNLRINQDNLPSKCLFSFSATFTSIFISSNLLIFLFSFSILLFNLFSLMVVGFLIACIFDYSSRAS